MTEPKFPAIECHLLTPKVVVIAVVRAMKQNGGVLPEDVVAFRQEALATETWQDAVAVAERYVTVVRPDVAS